jgi:DNA (cytosine-5)-methyltransferase 1
MDRVISLFSGAGGLSSGFADAGLKPVLAAELNKDACSTYERNLGLAPLNLDLGSMEAPSKILKALGRHSVDAVIGGPPCQGFSTAGGRRADDPRNRLIFNYFAVVEALQPRWFLFENVEGLLTSDNGRSVVDLVRTFVAQGYCVRLEKINFAAYGLPQSRKRVLLIGNRIGADFRLPKETHSFNAGKHRSLAGLHQSPSLVDALAGLGMALEKSNDRVSYLQDLPMSPYDEAMRRNCKNVSMHRWSASMRDKERFSLLKPGQSMKDLPTEFWHESFARRAFRRVKDGTPTEKRGGAPSGIKRLETHLNSPTITSAASQEFIHPTYHRPLTLREAARLQSFPDDFEFDGSDVAKAMQIGNAFPPLVSKLFARHFLEIEGAFGGGRLTPRSASARLLGFRLTDSAGMSPALRTTAEALATLADGQDSLQFAAAE